MSNTGVGAQLTLGETFLPEKYVWKINKMPEFYTILARKMNKIPEFYMTFARKMPEFYIIIGRIFFSIFFGGRGARARFLYQNLVCVSSALGFATHSGYKKNHWMFTRLNTDWKTNSSSLS